MIPKLLGTIIIPSPAFFAELIVSMGIAFTWAKKSRSYIARKRKSEDQR